jgi:hypothetical protein
VAITAPPAARTVTLGVDGDPLTVPEGTTIYDAAKSAGIDIPVLCHDERYDPVGVCRMCVVDLGARVYAAACVRPCGDGMEVKTATPEVEQRRGTLTQLLMADQPPTDGRDHPRLLPREPRRALPRRALLRDPRRALPRRELLRDTRRALPRRRFLLT